MKQNNLTRDETLAHIRKKLGGHGAATRLARICRVSIQASNKWLRDGIPPDRVELIAHLTGLPPHIIRPDHCAPRLGAGEL